ncbi:hypothetical protein [Streptomyces sp. 147326]|uniref:hypothetical protein n=1 Tax=Streptomyces sp. 147326 TaxID=3074379 RepID=UPI003857B136
MPGWSTDADADALAALSAGTFGLTVKHLATPGTPPLAVLGEARVIDRFRSGSGSLRLTLAWPAGLRGTAASGARGGPVRHGVAHVGPGEGCVCTRHDCGGAVPASWCEEHGDAVGPVLEWHPGGGIRCTDLSLARLASGSLSADLLHEVGEGVLGPGEAFGGLVQSVDVDDAGSRFRKLEQKPLAQWSRSVDHWVHAH